MLGTFLGDYHAIVMCLTFRTILGRYCYLRITDEESEAQPFGSRPRSPTAKRRRSRVSTCYRTLLKARGAEKRNPGFLVLALLLITIGPLRNLTEHLLNSISDSIKQECRTRVFYGLIEL